MSSSKGAIVGWVITIIGILVWGYGYFATGHPPLVDWKGLTPSWISDYIPNLETEIGIAMMLIALVPMYWPKKG